MLHCSYYLLFFQGFEEMDFSNASDADSSDLAPVPSGTDRFHVDAPSSSHAVRIATGEGDGPLADVVLPVPGPSSSPEPLARLCARRLSSCSESSCFTVGVAFL